MEILISINKHDREYLLFLSGNDDEDTTNYKHKLNHLNQLS